jgi:hypothetical protein
MTGLSPETGGMAADAAMSSAPLSLSARAVFEAYRKRAQEARLDRRARPPLCRRGRRRYHAGGGLRRANLAADYVRTSVVVAEPFTNPPG